MGKELILINMNVFDHEVKIFTHSISQLTVCVWIISLLTLDRSEGLPPAPLGQ